MGAEMTIVGAGIVAFLFIYMMTKIDDKHFILKVLLLFLSAISILLIGQGVSSEQYNCSWLVNNSTQVSASVTSYAYAYTCDTTISGSNTAFYKLTLWFLRLLFLYAIIYFLYMTFQFVKIKIKDKKSSFGKRFNK